MACRSALLLVLSFAPLLLPGAMASRLNKRLGVSAVRNNKTAQLHDLQIESVPMFLYKQDCWKKRPVFLQQGARSSSFAAKAEDAMVPGAGMDPIEPFQTVLKDGFYHVGCYQDYMLQFGDKFGDNRYEYNQGEVSNVSIVRYDVVVPKMDREDMTPSVCFAFCRTVPNMTFFGINNGRNCYCMPYFKPMEGDDAMCDTLCEGDQKLMCGSKSKTTIFEMHLCQKTGETLTDSAASLKEVDASMTTVRNNVEAVANLLKENSEKMQADFGQVGDSAAGASAQSAKIWAGKLLEATNASAKLSGEIASMEADSSSFQGVLDFSATEKAEELLANIEEATAEATLKSEELEKLLLHTNATGEENVSHTYKEVMYFVDKEFLGMPSTCGGTELANPMVGSVDGCAKACDDKVADCVGFGHFADAKLCFLFSKLTSVTYYTGCSTDPSLLQKDHAARAAEGTMCYAKFSKFSGTTLKPDPEGKCPGCLTTATKADRCFTSAS